MIRHLMALWIAGCAGCSTTPAFPPDHAAENDRAHHTAPEQAIPNPLSAHKALRNVLDIVASPSTESYVLVRAMRSDYWAGKESFPPQVRVRLDLTILGRDDVEATARFIELVNELESSPWCKYVERQATETLADGSGIFTDDLRINVQFSPSRLNPAARRSALDPELYIRSVAAQDSIGGLTIKPKTRQPIQGATDLVTHLRPAQRQSRFSQEHVLAFMEDLDDESQGVFVTHVNLHSAAQGAAEPAKWFFEAQCTTRTPRLE